MKNKTKNPAAVALGKISTPTKAKAARENGKLGGRPKSPAKTAANRANAKLPRKAKS